MTNGGKKKVFHLILWCSSIMFVYASKRQLAWTVDRNAQVARRNFSPYSAQKKLGPSLTRIPLEYLAQGISLSGSYGGSFLKLRFGCSVASSPLRSQNELDDVVLSDDGGNDDKSDAVSVNTGDNDESDDESNMESIYQPGIPKGFFIIDHVIAPTEGFDMNAAKELLGASEIDRSKLTSHNVSLPVALMLVDAETFPSLSRARKTCR